MISKIGVLVVGAGDSIGELELYAAKSNVEVCALRVKSLSDISDVIKKAQDDGIDLIVTAPEEKLDVGLIDKILGERNNLLLSGDDISDIIKIDHRKHELFKSQMNDVDFSEHAWKKGQPNCQPHRRRKRGVNRGK